MSKSMKKMLLLAKTEVTPGTDPVPTAAANSILCRGLMPELINADYVPRDLIRGYKGNSESLPVGVHRRFQFEVELAGSGTAGTAPKWGPILKACGFSETVQALTDVTYAPVSSGEDTVTLYAYVDGLLFKLTYGKGTVKIALDAKSIPTLQFDFLGVYSDATDTAFPTTQDFTGFTLPKTVGKVNTPTFSIHGVAGVCSNLSLDLANNLMYRDLIGAEAPHSPDRKPTGNATFELTSVATKNWGSTIRAGTTGALQVVHGTAAGNIITIDAPAIQFNSASIQNQDEIAMLNTGFTINPSASTGNDELTLTLT